MPRVTTFGRPVFDHFPHRMKIKFAACYFKVWAATATSLPTHPPFPRQKIFVPLPAKFCCSFPSFLRNWSTNTHAHTFLKHDWNKSILQGGDIKQKQNIDSKYFLGRAERTLCLCGVQKRIFNLKSKCDVSEMLTQGLLPRNQT